ncbi:hypothetical protein K9M79_07150 [Candidatus Woesearchaeota archaeon]|nr:hypothetical protein [Candidatus Woesearchaeota archaeon]
MKKSLDKAKEEIKRVDHLIYVSLKYTRTSDVLVSVVERIISFYDCLLMAMLLNAQEQKIIEDFPKSPGLRCELVKKIMSADKKIQDIVDFYLMLRRLTRTSYTVDEEYKRHVTLNYDIDSQLIEINIDIVTEYYKECKENLGYIEDKLTTL